MPMEPGPTPVAVPTRGPSTRTVLIALAAGLALIVGAGIMGGDMGSSSPEGSHPRAAVLSAPPPPTPVQSVAPSAPPVPSATPSATWTPVLLHVTGQTVVHGIWCAGGWCRYDGYIGTSEERLPGCYLMQTAGGNETGTWGTMAMASTCVEGLSAGMFEATVSWLGEWFTAGPRPVASGDAGPSALWPVDTIWLNGVGEHQGLSAVLRIGDTGQVDGWLFPTPVQSVAPSARPIPSASPRTAGTPELVRVAGVATRESYECPLTGCSFYGAFKTGDPRLPGCYVLQLAGGTGNGTWGVVALARQCRSGFDPGPFEATVTWQGEWFTTGPRPWALDDSVAGESTLWPVDIIWLHGLGEREGLSAVMRIGETGQIDGWLFATPPRP